MDKIHLIKETTEKSLEISFDDLSAPGSLGYLAIKAEFNDERLFENDRFNDESYRKFKIKCRLSRSYQEHFHINADIIPDHGSSYLIIPPDMEGITLYFPDAVIVARSNDKFEMSYLEGEISAYAPKQAQHLFCDIICRFLDRASYLNSVPIFIDLVKVYDPKNEVQYVYFTVPSKPTTLPESEQTLYVRMAPIYALYRESKNTSSPYYKLLCQYKILEGIFGSVGKSIKDEASLSDSAER